MRTMASVNADTYGGGVPFLIVFLLSNAGDRDHAKRNNLDRKYCNEYGETLPLQGLTGAVIEASPPPKSLVAVQFAETLRMCPPFMGTEIVPPIRELR